MIYILAGMDGTGKSSVFAHLQNVLDGDYILIKESCNNIGKDVDVEMSDRLRRTEMLEASGKDVVYDRASVVDDFIYSWMTNRREPAMAKHMHTIKQLMQKVTVIYFDCNVVTAVKRLAIRGGDDYVSGNDLCTIERMYKRFFEEYGVKPFVVNANKPLHEVKKDVEAIVKRKKFKVAEIVPTSCLDTTKDNPYYMCLANVSAKDPKYAKFYGRCAGKHGSFVLMDNGAAEGDQLSIEELIAEYEKIKPSQVVLPDTLLDGKDTLRKSRAALETIKTYYSGNPPFTFMAVPQGRTLSEWAECAEEFVQWPDVKAIGISKFLVNETGEIYIRAEAANVLDKLIKKYNRYGMEAHLLGCSESPVVINGIHNRFRFIRGCDSAYAYICTQAGVNIFSDTKRPEGEIDFIGGPKLDNLEYNMHSFEIEAGAWNNAKDVSWEE